MHRFRLALGSLLAAAALGASTFAAAAPVAGAQQMPPSPALEVTGRHVDGSVAMIADPLANPPGANLADCRPSPEHPRPVLLVHGITSNLQQNWVNAAPYLANEGFCVYSFTYGTLPLPAPLSWLGGLGPMDEIDRQMAAAVADVRSRTGAEKIDLVAHSMGTVVTNSYVKLHGGADDVHTVVNLAGVMGGQADPTGIMRSGLQALTESGVADGVVGGRPAALDILVGSPRIDALNAGGSPYVPGVEYTNIVSTHDETIVPYTSGLADGPNARNIVLQHGCAEDRSDHGAVAAAPRALAHMRNALAPDHPVPVPCVPVLPLLGPVPSDVGS